MPPNIKKRKSSFFGDEELETLKRLAPKFCDDVQASTICMVVKMSDISAKYRRTVEERLMNAYQENRMTEPEFFAVGKILALEKIRAYEFKIADTVYFDKKKMGRLGELCKKYLPYEDCQKVGEFIEKKSFPNNGFSGLWESVKQHIALDSEKEEFVNLLTDYGIEVYMSKEETSKDDLFGKSDAARYLEIIKKNYPAHYQEAEIILINGIAPEDDNPQKRMMYAAFLDGIKKSHDELIERVGNELQRHILHKAPAEDISKMEKTMLQIQKDNDELKNLLMLQRMKFRKNRDEAFVYKEDAEKDALEFQHNAENKNQNVSVENDDLRYGNKEMLKKFSDHYTKLLNDITNKYPNNMAEVDARMIWDISELRKALDDIRRYSEMDVTVGAITSRGQNTGKYAEYRNLMDAEKSAKEEEQIYEQIFERLKKLEEDIYNQQVTQKFSNDDLDNVYVMTNSLLRYFDGQRGGNLIVPDGAKVIDMHNTDIPVHLGKKDVKIKKPDGILFPHDPCYNDIIQGELGDCYLVSSLAAIALKHPDKIKEAMVDNDDGTVTVRFYSRKRGNPALGQEDTFEPIYVTVDKVVPVDGSAKGCLWVQTLEAAYAASGLAQFRQEGTMYTRQDGTVVSSSIRRYAEAAPSREELAKRYKEYKKLDPYDLPSHEEDPWLIDENGKIRIQEFKPCYSKLESGVGGEFVEQFLGPDFEAEIKSVISMNKVSDTAGLLSVYSAEKLGIPAKEIKSTVSRNDGQLADLIYKSLKNDKNAVIRKGINILEDPTADLAYFVSSCADLYFKNAKKEIAHRMPGNAFGDPNKISTIPLNKMPGSYLADATSFKDYMLGIMENLYEEDLSSDPAAHKIRDFLLQPENSDYRKQFNDMVDELDDIVTPYNGKYTSEEKELLSNIQNALKEGQVVTLGTLPHPIDNTGDTSDHLGLVCGHGFTVTGVVEHPQKKGVYLLKTRNPHASNTRDYFVDQETGNLVPGSGNRPDGEGYIELRDAFHELHSISFNGKKEPEQAEAIKEKIDARTLSRYYRILESVETELSTGSIFSVQKKDHANLMKALKNTRKEMIKWEGFDFKMVSRQIKANLEGTLKNYKAHCEKEQSSSSVRKTRLAACDSLERVLSMMSNKVRDPKAAALDEISRKITDNVIGTTEKNFSETKRAEISKNLKDDQRFKDSFGKLNLSKLVRAANGSDQKLKKALCEFAKTEIKEQRFKNAESAEKKESAIKVI